ncbi:hypothetical protein ACSVC9_14495 [Clostridium sp. LBM24168]
MSDKVELVVPSVKYFLSYVESIKEYKQNNVQTYDFSDPNQCDIFDKFQRYRTGNNIPEDHVQAIIFGLLKTENLLEKFLFVTN